MIFKRNKLLLLNAFISFIKENNLFRKEDKILLATSGGIDSMVMCELFRQAGFYFGIAHCNFQLRGKDSDLDADLTEAFAKSHKLPYYSTNFETQKIASERKTSIQIVARDLRYGWLEQIRSSQQYAYIATAHHLNDSIETVLYNFTKGCGIRGLHGIPLKNDLIIRPLLFAERQQILDFQIANKIDYREDSSNASTKYSRNKIRHKVIPALKEINPAFEQTMHANLKRIKDQEAMLDYILAKAKAAIWTTKKEVIRIDVKALLTFPAPATILYELLQPFGFHGDQIQQLLREEHLSGTQFFSKTHRLILDRQVLLLTAIAETTQQYFYIGNIEAPFSFSGFRLNFNLHESAPEKWPENKHVAYLDYDKLNFPLTLRKWQDGDQFQPLGMNGKHQKLQDFFSNHKFSLLQKESTWLLCSSEEIIWIVGHRLSESVKITRQSKQVLEINFE